MSWHHVSLVLDASGGADFGDWAGQDDIWLRVRSGRQTLSLVREIHTPNCNENNVYVWSFMAKVH